MLNDDFMELREFCYKTAREKHKSILDAWCKEAKVKTPVGYYLDPSDGIYYIYTNKPGYLIGRKGCLVDKYQQILQSQFSNMKSIKFVEIKGGFSNCADD
jgi:hypothetical protein